jgi:uncharacterized membrane protein
MLRQPMILLHMLGAILWIGGMFFAYFCLRPAAGQVLQPPQRLPLWSATFGRFLPITAVTVVVIIATGFWLILQVGFRNAPVGWHIMMSLGLLMAVVFAYVYLLPYPRLRQASAAADWPRAGAALNAIRRAVALNLLLGLGTVVAATWHR